MAEISILQKYDEAFAQYFVDNYAVLYPALDVQVLVATPDRQFADFTTKKFVDNRMLKLPRIQVYRGGMLRDPARHNPNVISKFGVGSDDRSFNQTRFPTAVNITYQIGFWTDKVHQANRWLERLLQQFHSGYSPKYFTVTVGDGWGDKIFPIFLQAIDNNSDLEPNEGPRAIRYDSTFRLEAWIFDQPSVDNGPIGRNVPAIFEVEVAACEQDTMEQLFKDYEPKGGL